MHHYLNNQMIYISSKLIANLCLRLKAYRSVSVLLFISLLNLALPLQSAAGPAND